jgi:hypothetical protein
LEHTAVAWISARSWIGWLRQNQTQIVCRNPAIAAGARTYRKADQRIQQLGHLLTLTSKR